MNLRCLGHTFFWAGTAMVLAGCGDGLDPELGLVNAFVHDTPGGSGAFMGTASGDFHVSIRLSGGPWVEVGSPNGITVALQSATPTTVHGSTSVPIGTYDRVRLTLSRVTFRVDAGGTIESTPLGANASAMGPAASPCPWRYPAPSRFQATAKRPSSHSISTSRIGSTSRASLTA